MTTLKELRELAEKATPGERHVYDDNDGNGNPPRPYWCVRNDNAKSEVDDLSLDVAVNTGWVWDAQFIAACDPSTVLKILDALECANAVIARWDTPLYKEAEATAAVIERLRNALAILEGTK